MDFEADFICLGVDLADCLAEAFFAVEGRGVVAFLDCGVAALPATDAGLLGIEAGFLAAASFLAFATATFLAATFGYFSIFVAGFLAGAFLVLGSALDAVFLAAFAATAFLAI